MSFIDFKIDIFYELLTRVLMSIICGLVIGINRQIKQKPAGIKTNILICLGATTYTYLGSLVMDPNLPSDPNRIMAQVISGIGFLGAGAILRSGQGVTGLTTAASIWVVAAIGCAIGLGAYLVALFAVLGVLFILLIMNPLFNLISVNRDFEFRIVSKKPIKKIFYGIILNSGAELLKISEKQVNDSDFYKSKILVNGMKKEIDKINSLTEEIETIIKIKYGEKEN